MNRGFKSILLKGIALSALPIAKLNANTTCTASVYQEKLPDSVKKLRKF